MVDGVGASVMGVRTGYGNGSDGCVILVVVVSQWTDGVWQRLCWGSTVAMKVAVDELTVGSVGGFVGANGDRKWERLY
jgi:hypothetical protein